MQPAGSAACHGMGGGGKQSCFNIDDRRIVGRYHKWVQDALTVTVAMFWRMGLDTDFDKTKEMV